MENLYRKIRFRITEREKEKRKAMQPRFSPVHPKKTPGEVDAAQLDRDRDAINDERIIDHLVVQPQ